MKYKVFYAALGAVLLSVVSCRVQETPEMAPREKTYKVHFVANEIQTRTVFGNPVEGEEGVEYPTIWSGNEQQIAVSLNLNGFKDAAVAVAQDGLSATFDADFPESELEAPYVFYALSPFSAAVSASETHSGFHLSIPTEQTPLAGSCDEDAQIITASQTADSIDGFGNVELSFVHVTAYGKMTLKNLALDSDDSIQSIDITASVPFAGEFYYDVASASLVDAAHSRTITILPDNLSVTSAGGASNIEDIWFSCAPASFDGGQIKVQVNTEKGKYTRTVNISGNQLAFKAGRVSKFSVNMASAEFEAPKDRWVLVSNASDLAAGDEVIIATSASAGAAYAMSTTQNTNNRGAVTVNMKQDADGRIIIQSPGSSVEVFTLTAGAYTSHYYFKETTTASGRYIGTTAKENCLRSLDVSTATNDTNVPYYNWSITVSNNVSTITAYQSVKSGNTTYYRQIRFNSNNGSPIFSAYRSTSRNSAQSGMSGANVYLYKRETGINVIDDPILAYSQFGAYLDSGNYVYGTGKQLSREYADGGTVTFAIIAPASYEVTEFSGIPADPASGDTFTLSFSKISGRSITDIDYDVTVVKVDGPKVWLSTGNGYGFIVKK